MNTNYLSLTSDKVNTSDIVFIPVGSVEVHGPSLPLGTDTFIAMAFAKKFAEKVKGTTLPPVSYGICPNTNRFKGTISVTHEALISYLTDICNSLKDNNFRNIIIINIHKGNDTAIKLLVEQFFIETRFPIYYINPYAFAKEELDQKLFTDKDNSYKEASLLIASLKILGLDKSVSYKNAKKDNRTSLPQEINTLREYGTVGYAYYKEAEHIGVRKDVDSELGLKYINHAAEKVPELINSLKKHFSHINRLNKIT